MAEKKMRYIAQRQAGDPLPGSEGKEEIGGEGRGGTNGGGTGRPDNGKSAGPGSGGRKERDDIWVRKDYLLFDLDGTLTDPGLGITSCVQYALKSLGIDEPNLDKLKPFIGPPLKTSFMEFYGLDDEKAEAAVAKYRERFQDTGIYENELYRGIPEMLKKLRGRGLHLGVASSKPTVFVERILEHFKIKQYFEVVVGSELDGSRSEKAEVVQEALRRLFPDGRIQKHRVFMIGDRKFDVEGARTIGVESVGVTFGYGGMEELMAAHADYIVRSVEELRRFLLRGFEDMDKDLNNFQKMWILIYQFVLFIAVRGLAKNVALVGLDLMGVKEISADLSTLTLGLGFLAGGAAIFKAARGIIRRTIQDMYLTHLKEDPPSSYVCLAAATATFSVGLAMLLNLSGFAKDSDAFQRVAESQASASLWAALITYGLIAPITEELLFRGVIYGYVRKFFDVRTAIIGSAILFGVYHGNMVQAVNAAVLGYFIAYAYEYFGTFRVPILMHVGINVLALIVEYTGLGKTGFVCWPVCIVFMLLGVGLVAWMARRKRIA